MSTTYRDSTRTKRAKQRARQYRQARRIKYTTQKEQNR